MIALSVHRKPLRVTLGRLLDGGWLPLRLWWRRLCSLTGLLAITVRRTSSRPLLVSWIVVSLILRLHLLFLLLVVLCLLLPPTRVITIAVDRRMSFGIRPRRFHVTLTVLTIVPMIVSASRIAVICLLHVIAVALLHRRLLLLHLAIV